MKKGRVGTESCFFFGQLPLLILALVIGVMFNGSPVQASSYLDDKILVASEPEMTRIVSDGSISRAFDFRNSWSIAIRDKLNYMISLNDSESPKAQKALDNLNRGEGYIVSTLNGIYGNPIEIAFYDADAEVDFYQYYHPSATAYAYRAASSPYFYLMSISFYGFATDNNINSYSQASLSHELFDKGYVSFTDHTSSVDDPSNYNFIYSNFNPAYQRHFFLIAMNNITYPPGYEGAEILGVSRLDYLALGDSYSSGEGDIERQLNDGTFYLEGTDVGGDYGNGVPQEKCHISTRSYPFLLHQADAPERVGMKSVACSGAKRVDIQGWSPILEENSARGEQEYQGQANRVGQLEIPRLKGFNVGLLQEIARDEFVPGRVQQIEFVEYFRPKVVTLTIGGNDLGFGEVLRACISQVALYGSCDYATELGRKEAGSLIKNFRMQLVDAYRAIKESSPKTKLFVIGYPQFISSTQNFCGVNSALNRSDREFITESVSYLNQVVKSAAHQADAYYVDIEHALGSNILCTLGGDKYVNGLTAALSSDAAAAFHPNHKGHAAIAEHIKKGLKGQTLESFNNCIDNEVITCPGYGLSASPDIPDYFSPPSMEDRIVQAAEMARDVGNNAAAGFRKGAEYLVRLSPFMMQPNTVVSISLHSDPTSLGSVEVAPDGSIESRIRIPTDIPAGYHTLYAAGKTYSGDDVVYRQIVTVHGADESDIDENGMPDSRQVCGPFITPIRADVDSDGIDDACDPQIGEKTGIYRIRQGNPSRIYNNKPEDEASIFVERNVQASKATGIEDDYDPDMDGWSIVGVGKMNQVKETKKTEGTLVIGFEVQGDGAETDPYVPVVYAYSLNRSCIAYRPASLRVVKMNGKRNLIRSGVDSGKCL